MVGREELGGGTEEARRACGRRRQAALLAVQAGWAGRQAEPSAASPAQDRSPAWAWRRVGRRLVLKDLQACRAAWCDRSCLGA